MLISWRLFMQLFGTANSWRCCFDPEHHSTILGIDWNVFSLNCQLFLEFWFWGLLERSLGFISNVPINSSFGFVFQPTASAAQRPYRGRLFANGRWRSLPFCSGAHARWHEASVCMRTRTKWRRWKAAEYCRKRLKATKYCRKRPKAAEDCQRRPKAIKNGWRLSLKERQMHRQTDRGNLPEAAEACRGLPEGAEDCRVLLKMAEVYLRKRERDRCTDSTGSG